MADNFILKIEEPSEETKQLIDELKSCVFCGSKDTPVLLQIVKIKEHICNACYENMSVTFKKEGKNNVIIVKANNYGHLIFNV